MSSLRKYLEYQSNHYPKTTVATIGLIAFVGLWEMVGLSMTGYWSPIKQLKHSPSKEQYISSKAVYRHVLELYDKDKNCYLDSQEQADALRQMYTDRKYRQPNDFWKQALNGGKDSQNH